MSDTISRDKGTVVNATGRQQSLSRRRYQRGSLLEKSGSWYGRYLEDVKVADGSIRRVHRKVYLGDRISMPTAKLARRALDILVAPINQGIAPTRTVLTFAEFIAKWRATKPESHYARSTWRAINASLATFWMPRFGGLGMSDITTEVLQQHINQSALSPASLRTRLHQGRALWTIAETWGYVSHNPFAKLRLPRLMRIEARHFSSQQVQLIIDAAQEPNRTLFWLLAQTGLRIGEALGLSWDDFNSATGALSVNKQWTLGRISPLKTQASYRTLILSPNLAERLRAMPRTPERIFPFHPSSLLETLHLLLDGLNLPRAGFHAFRHTSISLMDEMQAPLKLRQQRVGHSNANLTLNTYTHVNSEGREVAEKFDAFFTPVCPTTSEALQTQRLAVN